MLILHHCQPLVLIFQLSKILEQRTLALLSLNLGFVPAFPVTVRAVIGQECIKPLDKLTN